MMVKPFVLEAGASSPWLTAGRSVLFLYGDGTAVIEYSTEAGEPKRWVCSESVALGRPYPLDAPGGGCFVRITNQSEAQAAFSIAEDSRR